MNYVIKNDQLTVTISDLGAELQSIVHDGTEYLWNGDPTYWKSRSPILFPFVGRFTDGKYTLNGKEYEMGIHGFAKLMTYEVEEQFESSITFLLTENEETLKQYPYHFAFRVIYTLDGNALEVKCEVENDSEEMMYFGIGGHPAFNVPMEEGLAFEDYRLEFAQPCQPEQIEFSPTVMLSGKLTPYELVNGTSIPLRHDLFDHDAVVLQHMADTVKICSDKGTRSVTVSYPDMPYVGFWHAVKKDAPYVCIEPWCTLPSRQDIVEEFTCKSDMIRLPAGEKCKRAWTAIFE